MKTNYPIEAFALAMVLFTNGIEEALIVGTVLIAGTLLGDLLARHMKPAIACVTGGVVTFLGLIGCLAAVNLISIQNFSEEYLFALLLAVLVARHVIEGADDAADMQIMKQNYIMLAAMIMVAAVREFLSEGALFGYTLTSAGFVSSAYGRIYFGLIFAGIGMAAANAVTGTAISSDSLWVAVPAALAMMISAVSGGFSSAALGTLAAAVISVVLLTGIRKRLVYSTPGKYIAGLPIEMISMGFLTMILTVIC